MNKTTIAYTGVLVVAVLLTWISVAYAETYDVEITPSGFNPVNATVNQNDHLRFVSTTTTTWIISNPMLAGTPQDHVSPSGITYIANQCGEWNFILYEDYETPRGHIFTLTVDCPQPEVVDVVPTNSTSTTIVEEDVIVQGTLDVETAEVLEEIPVEETTTTNESASNETLGLRLQILQVLENILAIIFGA